MTTASTNLKDRVLIFDTTLRDGEQCPGATMRFEEKLEIAALLDTMGVDIIEAGFPATSDGDFASVQEIAKRTKKAVVCGLARATDKDISRTAEAIAPAARGRIHTFIGTSPVHRDKLRMDQGQVLDAILFSVKMARNLTDDVEWSAEDATRTEHDFLCRCVEVAIRAGATTINLPDTVGCTVPDEYFALFKMVRERVPNTNGVRFSVHCHNDLGMAVANSIWGIRAGARQIECTINGIGERAGNAALEEVVMAMRVRKDIFPYETGIDATMLTRVSKLVSAVTSFPVQYNKAIVGRNAFAHASGIHQHGMIRDPATYEIMRPEDVGRPGSELPVGKHSGRAGLIAKIRALGYPEPGDNQLNVLMGQVKALAAKKKDVYDEDIEALIDEEIKAAQERIKLLRVTVISDTRGLNRAILRLSIDGKDDVEEAEGNGPIDAVFNCIKKLVPHEAEFSNFDSRAIGKGTDAQADASLDLSADGISVTGRAADPDSNAAAAKAYLHALNTLLVKQRRKHVAAK